MPLSLVTSERLTVCGLVRLAGKTTVPGSSAAPSSSAIRRTVSLPQQPHKLAFGPTALSGKRTLSELSSSSYTTGLSAVAKGKMRQVDVGEPLEDLGKAAAAEKQSKFFGGGAKKVKKVEKGEDPSLNPTISLSSARKADGPEPSSSMGEAGSSPYLLSPCPSSSRAGTPARALQTNADSIPVSSPTSFFTNKARISPQEEEGYISSSPPPPSPRAPAAPLRTVFPSADENGQPKGGVDLRGICLERNVKKEAKGGGNVDSESICGSSDEVCGAEEEFGSGKSEEEETEERMEKIAMGWREKFSLKKMPSGSGSSVSLFFLSTGLTAPHSSLLSFGFRIAVRFTDTDRLPTGFPNLQKHAVQPDPDSNSSILVGHCRPGSQRYSFSRPGPVEEPPDPSSFYGEESARWSAGVIQDDPTLSCRSPSVRVGPDAVGPGRSQAIGQRDGDAADGGQGKLPAGRQGATEEEELGRRRGG